MGTSATWFCRSVYCFWNGFMIYNRFGLGLSEPHLLSVLFYRFIYFFCFLRALPHHYLRHIVLFVAPCILFEPKSLCT